MHRRTWMLLMLAMWGTLPASATEPTRLQASAQLAASEARDGSDSPATADALAHLVDAASADFYLETHADEFAALAQREVALRSRLDGEHSLVYAAALQRLAMAQGMRFNHNVALANIEQAAQIINDPALKATAAMRANATLLQGFARRNLRSDMEGAATLLQRGLDSGADLPPLQRAQASLWLVGVEMYRQRDANVAAALDSAEQTLRSAARPQHPLHADLTRYRSQLAMNSGDQGQAIALADAAIVQARDAQPYSPALRYITLFARGQIEQRIGNLEGARSWFEQARKIDGMAKLYGGFSLALLHYDFCNNYGRSGKFAEAEAHCREAIRRFEALPMVPPIECASALLSLGSVLVDQGREQDALLPYRQSIGYAEKSGSAVAAFAFGAETGMAAIYLHRGEYTQAETVLRRQRARIGERGDFAARTPRTTEAGLSAALWGQGRDAEAFALAAKVEQSAARVRRLSASDLDERRALRSLQRLDGGLDWMLAISAAKPQSERVRQTWNALLDAYGVQTAMAVRRLAMGRAAAEPALAADWQTWQLRNSELSAARVTAAQADTPTNEAHLSDAEHTFDAAELALAQHTGEAGVRLTAQSADLDQVLMHLPPNATLLRFVESAVDSPRSFQAPAAALKPQLYAFVANSGEAPQLVALGSSVAVSTAADRWYELSARADADRASLQEAGVLLRKLVWDPVSRVIQHQRVLVLNSRALDKVNLAALPGDGGGYLVEQHWAFHTLAHERELLRPAAPRAEPRTLLAGAPTFGEVDNDTASITRGLCPGLSRKPLSALPGARAEISAIASLGEPGVISTQILQGDAATEAAVREALVGKTLLHFATHGIFLGDRCTSSGGSGQRGLQLIDTLPASVATPTANLSALAFSGANRQHMDNANDGLLTSDEIAALDLSGVSWAVLSACETALGPALHGEGSGGLRRAFALAGVRTIITSLWRVDDAATVEFMRALYLARLVQHADTVDAMQFAMHTTLAARRARGESTSPYYWAGFLASGDWR